MSSTSYWPELIALYISSCLNLISPGVAFALVFDQAAHQGRKIAFITLAGLLTSSALHRGCTLFGLNILSNHPDIIVGVKLFGGSYLILLSVRYYRRFFGVNRVKVELNSAGTANEPSKEYFKAYRLGFFTDILNPQATVGFLALVASTLSPEIPLPVRFWMLLVLLVTSVAWYSSLIFFVSHPFFKMKILRYRRAIDGLTAVCLSMIGAQILWTVLN